ncbi:serine hydrolase domain-containing protein [soil metagenome]
MSEHAAKTRSRVLLAVAAFALVSGCSSSREPASSTVSLAGSARPSEKQPTWPIAAEADPAKLGFSAEGLQALDARMREAVDKGQIAGINYALVKDGKVVAYRFLGNQTLGGPPMDKDTLFRIRSMGKSITAVAMMQLWEQGKWKPEDPITKFLPELANLKVATSPDNLDNLAPIARTPTMNELMTHTAGFAYGINRATAAERAMQDADVGHAKDMRALVDTAAKTPLAVQPGERWNYSIAVDLQGAIIERITGKTLGEYFEQNIFAPLKMDKTGFWLKEAERPHLATVYTRDAATGSLVVLPDKGNTAADDPFKKNSNFESGGGGASGLISTMHDFVRFTQMLVNKGELGGRRVLKPDTVAYMTQNHIGGIKGVLGGDGYGFGYGGRVVVNGSTATTPQPNGAFSHFSIEGAWYWIDPASNLSFVGLIQRRGGGGPGAVAMGGEGDAARLVYKALAK